MDRQFQTSYQAAFGINHKNLQEPDTNFQPTRSIIKKDISKIMGKPQILKTSVLRIQTITRNLIPPRKKSKYKP